jgi:signal peptidase II
MRKWLIPLGITLLVDQATKYWAVQNGWVIWNEGVSFGLLGNKWLSLAVMMLGLLVLARFLVLKSWFQKYPISTGLLLGGAVSNFLDRLLFGAVRDWLPLPLLSLSLKNNLADWAVCLSLLILAYRLFQAKIRTS